MADTADKYEALRQAIAAGPTKGPLYMRTNRHPETDGTPWGWVDMYPAGSMNKASPAGVNVTWRRGDLSAVNARYIIESRPDTIAALLAERDALRELLAEAITEIDDWAAYAAPIFREKHDLEGTLARFRAALSRTA